MCERRRLNRLFLGVKTNEVERQMRYGRGHDTNPFFRFVSMRLSRVTFKYWSLESVPGCRDGSFPVM